MEKLEQKQEKQLDKPFIQKPLTHPLYLTETDVEKLKQGEYAFDKGRLVDKSGKVIQTDTE